MPIHFRDIVEEFRDLHAEQGISLEEMASILGDMTAMNLYEIERGDKTPSYLTVCKMMHWIGKITDDELDKAVKTIPQSKDDIDSRLDRIEDKIDKVIAWIESQAEGPSVARTGTEGGGTTQPVDT